ncbi:MAG: LytTR family DNA-binding domain-containing protein [Bacteroidales bacterium]|nr:LytTR family DNA-binding domain-containing protein [Bacteroidales bacterium]
MSKEVKIILVEDEEHNLRLLQGMIGKLRPGWQVAGTFESVKNTVEWLRNNSHPDLIFLDIQLADGLCFSIFDQVDVQSMVIFTTAYDNYAIRAFKVNSIDYLLKPFKESELETAIRKFESFTNLAGSTLSRLDYLELLDAIRRGGKKYRKRFLISKGDGFVRLDVDDIAYFYNENRITTAFTFGRQTHMVDFSLDGLEEQLDPENFHRANRQLIVNIKAVDKIENYFGGKLKLRLNPPLDGDLTVSRLKAMSFRQWLGQ